MSKTCLSFVAQKYNKFDRRKYVLKFIANEEGTKFKL